MRLDETFKRASAQISIEIRTRNSQIVGNLGLNSGPEPSSRDLVSRKAMSAEIYPSGAWRGFYSYGGADRHPMQLDLLFSQGIVAGDGIDDIGSFLMNGSYDRETGVCRWIKTYTGAHDVTYSGSRDGNGISGTWQLQFGHGTFRIWPGKGSDGVGADESVEAELDFSSPELVKI